jgi:hypothetical protein
VLFENIGKPSGIRTTGKIYDLGFLTLSILKSKQTIQFQLINSLERASESTFILKLCTIGDSFEDTALSLRGASF